MRTTPLGPVKRKDNGSAGIWFICHAAPYWL